jgi:hypothetical protein
VAQVLGVLAFVVFLLAWAFALFGGPHAAFFHPLTLAFLGLALLAAHLVFPVAVPWRRAA